MKIPPARNLLILWSVLMLVIAFVSLPGTWTIDDAVKGIAATKGQGLWGTPILNGELRHALSDESAYPVLVPPFADIIEGGVNPGFSPYARAWAGLESVFSRKALIYLSVVVAIATGWLLYYWGLEWGFLFLPLTFYGLVPWEHGLALLLSIPAVILAFQRDKSSPGILAISGALLALAVALRIEHGILALLVLTALILQKRTRESLAYAATFFIGLGVLMELPGRADFFRQSSLNHSLAAWQDLSGYLGTRGQAISDTLLAIGPNPLLSITMILVLAVSVWLLNRSTVSRVTTALGWIGVVWFAVVALRVVWGALSPVLSLLTCGSLFFALPWVMLLIVSKKAWKTKAMAYAIAALVLGVLLIPISSGVHWGPRLLLFASPLLLLAFYQANLVRERAFAAVIVLSLIQTASSATLVHARFVESSEHITRIAPHAGSPMITTTRAQAIDLYPLWQDYEFFTAATPDELKRLLVEFYLLQQDSAWLHLEVTDSLFIQTFPKNKPVWPHRMSVVNCGSLWRTQWRLYQLVMNRADPEWIPLLETEAARAVQSSDNRRALFLQDAALVLNPALAEAHSNLALLLARMNKPDEARQAVARALELDSTLLPARELARQLGLPESASSN